MATIEVTEENYSEVTSRDGIVIIDFWADWCSACKFFAPIYEAASEANPDVVFGTVDVEAATAVADSFGIRALPTLAVFRDQIRVYLQAGALPKPDLDELLTKVKELDMEQVRSDMAKVHEHAGHARHDHAGHAHH